MEYKEYDNKVSSMLDKIGNDSAGLILDDVAVLLTDNKQMNEELTMYNARYNRIISSDSIVDKTGTYTGTNFTTATYNGSLHHGMSYFVDCQTPNITFTIKIYIAGTSRTVYTGSLTQDDYEATNTFYLNGNSDYYIKVIPSESYAVYDFAYNIYYNTVDLNNN